VRAARSAPRWFRVATASSTEPPPPSRAPPYYLSFGTIFRITLAGAFSTLHTFIGSDSGNPAGLVVLGDGSVYGWASGTTARGSPESLPMFFRLSPSGTLQPIATSRKVRLYNLRAARDGSLVGTSWTDDANSIGALYRVTTRGRVSLLEQFEPEDGPEPWRITYATSGALYVTGRNTFLRAPPSDFVLLARLAYTLGALPLAALIRSCDGTSTAPRARAASMGMGRDIE